MSRESEGIKEKPLAVRGALIVVRSYRRATNQKESSNVHQEGELYGFKIT